MPRFNRLSLAAQAVIAMTTAVIFAISSPFASATPIASASASETPSGVNFQYSLTLHNNSAMPGTAATAIGTFWFAWIPGEDFLHTSPLTEASPTGWQETITHGGATDGYAIQWTTTSSAFDLAAGASLSGFGFTSADAPSSVFGNSFFYATTPTMTSFAYEAAPFSDAGNQFVASSPEPAAAGLLSVLGVGMLARRRRKAFPRTDSRPAGPQDTERLENRCLMSATIPAITQTNLVSDMSAIPAAHVDPNMLNPWGIAIGKTGNVWLADNTSGLATVYDQTGVASPLVVTVPPPTGQTASFPTGLILNNGKNFDVTSDGKTGPGVYIFATEDGTISAWSPTVDSTHAILAVDHSETNDVFKGLAILGSGKSAKLYATDFHNGHVEVFDGKFQQQTLSAGAFTDPQIPAGFAPFGIQALKGKIYVSYALQDDVRHDDVPGAGNGYVDVYDKNGRLLHRAASAGTLNSPWGMTLIPAGFGKYSGDLLVGNFGDGTLNVIDKRNNFVGQLTDTSGATISIDGLWALTPGVKQHKKTLFFTAGPNEEADGVFGALTAVTVKNLKAGNKAYNR